MVDSRQDWELLQDYAEHGSQAAFATLVERYVHFVYSVCRREVHDAVLAEDVTQVVFLLLAKKAPTLGEVRTLSGWLFNTARFAAKSTLRQEARRAKWEQKAATDMLSECEHGTGQWDDIEPLLNEALTTLSPGEREAVFLRFCEGKSLQETGATLGVSESGAAKRISRALDKLRAYFGRHGFALSALVLTGLIKENAVEAAPASCMTAAMQIGWGVTPGLVATEVVSAQTASVKAVSLCQGVLKAMLLSKIQTGAVTILTISLLVTGGHQLARLSRAHSADLPQSIMAKSPSGKSSSVRLAPPAHVATKLSPLHRFPKWAKLTMPVRQKISVPSLSYAWLAAYGSGAATAAPLTQIGFSDPTTVGATTTGAITTGAITTDAQVIDAGSQQPNEEPAIKLGEISLTGKIQVVTLAGSRMILAVDAFTLPSGKTSRLTTPKAKTVIVNAQTALYVRHQSQQKVTLQQISLGTSAIVIGQDTGSGKPLTARLVIVWNAQQDGAFRLNPAPAPQPEKHVTTGPEDASGPRPRVGPTQPEDPQAGQAQMELLIGHMGSITALAYAPDGTLLASGSHDRTIKLWDTRTGKVLHTLDAHTDNVTTLAFSPDGNLLASGSFDRVIEIWDVQTASLRCAIPQQARTTAVVFAPKVGGNDRYLATASWDHAVRIWDIPDAAEAKPEVVWSWPQTDLEPEALAFSPDGKLLA
ncbi:MAG: sigma-70 family RNA polymerase sigma factor, partial [Abitibacteriaceae bacterium]|nr:sigma-70 family RNA polymerase sigma factor [Abditibacteriaceae bacterium]